MSFNDKSGKSGGKRPGGNKTFKGGAKPSGGGFGKGGFAKREGQPGRERPEGERGLRKPGQGKPFAARAERPARAEKPMRDKAAAPAAASAAEPERISKLLARAGVASRRDVERMIMEGRVSVNGAVLETPVHNATFEDTILVDGKPIRGPERTRLWLYHKPAGLVTTNSDPEGRPTVFDNLPEELPRVLSIGRLDINTEGLLLLTNDGGLARTLELPKNGWLRRYRVRAHGKVEQTDLDALKEGVAVNGVLYGGIEATLDRVQGSNVWITMAFREGKNREVKNVLGSLGLEVNRLIRLSYGPFQLGDLPEGAVVEVRGRMLRDQLGPRLIEESGANFEAPIFTHSGETDEDEAPAAKPARRAEKTEDRREGKPAGRPGKEGFAKGGKPARGFDKPRRDFDEDDDKPKRKPLGSNRTVNIWMAPGAKPLGPKQAAKATRPRPESAPYRPVSDKPSVASTIRRSGEENEWISASEAPARKGRDDDKGFGRRDSGDRKGFGGKRDFSGKPRGERSFEARGDRPERSERPFGDRPPRGDGPRGGFGGKRDFSGKPRGERSFEARGDRPERSERPFGDRPPRGDGPKGGFGGKRDFSGKPRGERSFEARGDRPERSERPFGDRPPRGDGPRGGFGGKPGGGKSFGGKPRGEGGAKPFGGKPRGPAGGAKPRGAGGGKPFGGKPGGGRGRG